MSGGQFDCDGSNCIKDKCLDWETKHRSEKHRWSQKVELKRLGDKIFNLREENNALRDKISALEAEIAELKHKEQCWNELNKFAYDTNNYWCMQENKICAYCNSYGMCTRESACPYHCVDIVYTNSARTSCFCSEYGKICEFANGVGGCSLTVCAKKEI